MRKAIILLHYIILYGIICLLIIGCASVALIISILNITYKERVKEIDMLSAIGMSNWQKKQMCLKEGGIITTIRSYNWSYNWGYIISSGCTYIS